MRWLCYHILKFLGWTYKCELPENLHSFVLLAAPHTSNFDIIPAMGVSYILNRNAKFIIKDSWLKFPMNLILKPMGALGVNREKLQVMKGNSTDVMAHLFQDYPEFVLMISPEGTRSPNENWKTGFYYIASKAEVPIVLGYVDYKKKETGFGPIIYPKNFEEDMLQISHFYREITGKNPSNFKLDVHFRDR